MSNKILLSQALLKLNESESADITVCHEGQMLWIAIGGTNIEIAISGDTLIEFNEIDEGE